MNLMDDLRSHGLQWRGAWQPTPADQLAPLADGQAVALVGMVGIVGSTFWPTFRASGFYRDGQPDPLDRWSRSIATPLAQRYGGRALFPFEGPPYLPFQRWADRAEATQSSPLLLRIHPEFGLWHAYRFALALPSSAAAELAAAPSAQATVPAVAEHSDLCAQCSGQPCLQACPVNAFDGTHYRDTDCATHLRTPSGQDCMQSGCLARRACPVGREFQYQPAHAAFHMESFVRAHRATP